MQNTFAYVTPNSINGRIRVAITKPPIIKQQAAINDGHCNADKPTMAWPLVQPLAYRVPKPTIKPSTTINKNLFKENKCCQLKICLGIGLLKSVMP